MSERIVVVDESVFHEINVGNQSVATALLRLHRANVQMYITNEAKIRLNTDADRRLMRDLNVQAMMEDRYADNPVRKKYVDRLQVHNQTTGSLVIHLSAKHKVEAELLTADKNFSDTFNKFYGKLAPESRGMTLPNASDGKPVPGPADRNSSGRDYNQARRMLKLKPLSILKNGQIPPPPPPAPKANPNAAPRVTINGKVYVPNGTPVSTQLPSRAKTVQQPKVDPKVKLDNNVKQPPKTGGGQVAGAKAAGVQLLIDGIGFTLGWLAEAKQQERFNADWGPKKAYIEKMMTDDPTSGCLAFVTYTVMQGTRHFENIRYEFGRTRTEALQRFQGRSNMDGRGPGELTTDEVGWFPPRKPIEPHNLPTPFRAVALATFAGRRNRIMDVQWKGTSAFDETGDETKLNIPAGLEPLFLILEPPNEMFFYNGSIRHNVKIEQYTEWPAETLVNTPMPFNTVDMDCQTAWVCGDTSAAMVYPAESYTESLFKKAPKIKDNLGQLLRYGLDDVRFIEPENIKIIEDYRIKTKTK